MARRVAVVAHTHWDREWYEPFPAFRSRLVAMLDELLTDLDADPAFSHFMLDGQVALVDDYLRWKPEAEARIRRLVAGGQLSIGPWYVLMDEFAVSGETIVRNLQRGIERAAAFGGAMAVGYLPDMFGHVAQMPQLLRSAGLDHAVVWRGVPRQVQRTGFWWTSPDGSAVRAEYLPVGYANGAHLPGGVEDLLRRVRAHSEEVEGFAPSPGSALLLMAGGDHQRASRSLPALLEAANDEQKAFDFELTSLHAHLAGAETEALPSWSGELRSGARANLLIGVHSNRVDLKAAAAVAERALEATAEPLAALWMPPTEWPEAAFDEAWGNMILNSAHDSICGCSADAVGTAVLHRYQEATATAESIAGAALQWVGLSMAGRDVVVVNPSATTRSGVIEVDLPAGTSVPGAQLLSLRPEGEVLLSGSGGDLPRLLGEHCRDGPLAAGATSAALETGDEGVELAIVCDASRPPAQGLAEVMAEAWAQAGAARDRPLRVRVRQAATQRLAVRVADVAGFGWVTWTAADGGASPGVAPVTGGDGWMDNGLIRLAVDGGDGTFSINGLPGFDRLVDGGDAGDTYNYSPPSEDRVVDLPESVEVAATEAGPVRGGLRVTRRYRWPARTEGGRRVGSCDVTVFTDLQLEAGSRLVVVTTAFDNPSRDHRLRAWVPLVSRAGHSLAETAFASVRRPLTAEGGPHEKALATFPSRRWVSAGGVTVTHEGLLEYEVVDDGGALAITLLRSTGYLSRPAPAYRPNPAGPALALQASQMVGPVRARYAVAVGEVDPYRLAEEAWVPLEAVRGAGGGSRPGSGSVLEVSGAEVSSLRRVHGGLELRVFNPSDLPAEVGLPGRSGWLVDLRGRPHERWTGSFTLRPWGIATTRLDGDL
ncbi:MAG: glycoside hydrolase family 38 C-terminal domain-containing protein [Acidimicrobiales bacterium]